MRQQGCRTPKMRERLQKIMAGCGVASRRACEEMIAAGRVTLNGVVVRELGTKADLDVDAIAVDGKRIERAEKLVYFLLNKPKGYVTTVSDPERRPTVMDLLGENVAVRTSGVAQSSGQAVRTLGAAHSSGQALPSLAEPRPSGLARVYPVGRLDYASEGLLVLTNDGALAQMLTKAGSHVPKTYWVKVSGKPEEEKIAWLRAGVTIELDDGRRVKTSPAKIKLLRDQGKESGDRRVPSGERKNPWYEVTLIEGRNRQIRRMFEKIGHHVEKIRRVRLGPLKLDVEVGKFRELKASEVEELKAAAEGGKGRR
jgi:23S rRNA pseudouridine2605 synthase